MSLKEKILQRMPTAEQLKQDRFLKFLGVWLEDPNLFHINRRSICGGVAIGLFCAWIPIPSQLIWAGIMAIWLRKNLPVAVLSTWITNPITVPPMFYFAYWVGSQALGLEPLTIKGLNIQLSMDWFFTQLGASWRPFFLGCGILAVISAVLGYVIMQLMWRFHVLTKLKERQKRMINRVLVSNDDTQDTE